MRKLREVTNKRLIETYEQIIAKNESSQNSRLTDKSVAEIKKEIEDMFIELCQQMNEQLPMTVDEITTLKSAIFAKWTLSCCYQVDMNLEDLEEDEWEQIMDFMREDSISEIPIMFSLGNYDITQDELYECLKVTGLKFRFVYQDINGKFIGAYQLDYKDFE